MSSIKINLMILTNENLLNFRDIKRRGKVSKSSTRIFFKIYNTVIMYLWQRLPYNRIR